MSSIDSRLFPGFESSDVATTGASIRTLRKGSGPPLLLLHGYPQTHLIWHKVANRLAERFTVVLTDLRGYGDSSKPDGGTRHANYSFAAMAQDQVDVMGHFGFDRFAIVAHDRGARVAHRLCLAHPGAVSRVCLMDIVPTLRMYRDTSKTFATAYASWFFLAQPAPFPEHMIGCDPDFFIDHELARLNATPGALTPDAIAEYKRCFAAPGAIRAICEDYRAAADIDLEMDEADEVSGRRVEAPMLVLWGAKNIIGRLWDVLAVWRGHTTSSVEGRALDCGHFLAEERPEEVLAEVLRFLDEER